MPDPKLRVIIDGNDAGLQRALGASSKSVKVFGHEFGVAMDIPTSAADLAVLAVKGVTKATVGVAKAAKDAAAEEQIFADSMKATGGATGDWVAQTDAAISASQKLAFTDTETRKALLSLTTATKDSAQATDLLGVSQDVARVAGVSLESASDAVAKAMAGQDSSLRKMLPGLEKGATAQETVANASKLAAGAADDYAASSQAMGEKARIAFSEIAETVGQKLGPSLRQLSAALKPLIKAFLQLIQQLLPPLLKQLDRMIKIAVKVAEAITKIVQAVTRLISKIKDLLGPLTDAVNKLRDFNIFNRSFQAAGNAVQSGSVGVSQQAAGAAVGPGVTINIHGDPAVIEAKVIRALKSYQQRNGTASLITAGRW